MANTQQSEEISGDSSVVDEQRKAKLSIMGSKKLIGILGGVIAVFGVFGAVYFLTGRDPERSADVYTLVPDKVSQSAAIAVALPDEIAFPNFNPQHAVHFTPEIKGTWEKATAPDSRIYRFLPEEKMPVGMYYLATLETPEIKMEKMFSIEKDPSVLAVFPKQETEVSEYSNITVMFSRPMVALSTLSENADITPPVIITPSTPGRFKWITTRTLQFIPEKRLYRASNYQVSVEEGLRSVDGVAVPAFSHSFNTRNLQYVYGMSDFSAQNLTHTEPIRVHFNQPINLERTRALITLTGSSSFPIQFTSVYGTRAVRDPQTGKEKILTDQSVLEVYPSHDSHGRPYLFDFGAYYHLTLAGAVPLEGDIPFTSPLVRDVHIEEIIIDTKAESLRSDAVNTEVFDPEGTLVVTTSEPIDLARSSISGKGVTKVTYGERCREPGVGEEIVLSPSDCAKVPDQNHLVIHFDPTQFGRGETSKVIFSKLVNTDKVVLNTEPLVQQFTTYKAFSILRTTPGEGGEDGSLTELTLCSTNPIAMPAEKDFYQKVKSNMMLGKWNWARSYFVTSGKSSFSERCPAGTYLTTISYGLVPKYTYELLLSLDDHFGQHLDKKLNFTTKDADPLAKGIVHMQPTVLMTTPLRTTLAYGLDFLNAVDVTICKVSAETMLRYRVFPLDITDSSDALSCEDQKSAHVVLPTTPATRKYMQLDLRTYFQDTPDILGNYVVTISNPDYRRVSYRWNGNERILVYGEQLFEKTYVSVTNLAVGSKQVERTDYEAGYGRYADDERKVPDSFMSGKWPSNLYWVNDYRTLTPSRDAVVTPYAQKDKVLVRLPSKKTDVEGIAETPSADNIAGAIVSVGLDRTVISNFTDALSYVGSAAPVRSEYLYTDRPMYRPGDTVHIKGISRIGYDGNFESDTGSTTLTIRDAKYETARTQEVHFNKNGTYEMTFVLDSKASLGYYQIQTQGGGYGSFQVEEYVAPQFRVTVSPDKEEYTSGDTAKVQISADYYFGVPVESGTVEYRLVSQDYYFDRYHDAYFSFGGGWYTNENGWYGDHYISSGKMSLDGKGKATLAQDLAIDKIFSGDYRAQSKLITMYVTVKNGNGQSVSSQRSFILHRGTFYAGITMDDYFYRAGGTGVVKVKTVDHKGGGVAKNNLKLTLSRIDWKSYKRQEVDGNFYYRTERTRALVSERALDTDRDGNGSAPFTAGATGEYEFVVSATDESGNPIRAVYDFYVSGEGSVSVRPTNNASLELTTQKTDLMVGEKGSFVIKSPYAHSKALVTLARGDIYERKVLDISEPLTRYEFTATKAEIPSVTAQVLLLSSDPEVKYGETQFHINTKEKELVITATPDKKVYVPGEEVVLRVSVRDAFGNPTKAEISLSVVDMSVLALTGNQKKDPVSFFYGYAPLSIRTAMNVKNILHIAEIPTGTKGGSGGGGDDLEKKKRGVFRDTAHWAGTVETDASGNAVVRFTLPDNLTQWQVESVGVTSDTKVGAGYTDFTTRKHLMAVPLQPRFIIPGDTFAVGGTVFNESETTQRLDVSVSSPLIEFTGETHITISIEPHSSVSVSFPARAPEGAVSGTHSFTLVAKNGTYEDTVTNSFPIEQNNTYEFTATGGRITEASWNEAVYLPSNVVPGRGGLTISLGATMATMVGSAVQGLLIYPYECTEQVASKLRTIAIVKQNAELFGTTSPLLPPAVWMGNRSYTIDEIVTLGLAKMYENEGADGGVSFYQGMAPNYWITRSALETYIELSHAGYAVDKNKMTLAAQYVFNRIMYPQGPSEPSPEEVISSAYVLHKLANPRFESDALRATLRGYANNTDLISRGLSTPALSYLAILSVDQKFGSLLTKRLFAEFENRSRIDARGTIVVPGIESPSSFYGNTLGDTALALKAFSESKRESPLLEGYLRAIKNGKTRDGGWSSTYNSMTVIDALTQYLKWKDEVHAQMNVSVSLNEQLLFSQEFDKTNILSTYATTVPLKMLLGGKRHRIEFTKKNLGKNADAYYQDMLLKYYLPAESIAPRDEGFSVTRAFYRLEDTAFIYPVASVSQGEVLRGRVVIRTPVRRAQVSVEDFIPAGVEIINQRFATEDQTVTQSGVPGREEYGTNRTKLNDSWVTRGLADILSFGGSAIGPKTKTEGIVSDDMYGNKDSVIRTLYPSSIEQHDDRIFAYIENLDEGEYVYEYFVRALVPGVYQHLPLVVSELYTPENFGRTNGALFTVTKK